MKGKQVCLPFIQSPNQNYGILEVVSSDICGPIRVKSIGASCYVLTFLDMGSRYSKCYFLDTKSASICLTKLKEFKAWIEKITGRKMKTLRTDRGSEFLNFKVQDFLKSEGITHQTTTRYTPQQNGAAERLNRTLVEKVRAMLHDSNLPYDLWAELWQTANYLRNFSPTMVLNAQKITPYEALLGKRPNVGHLRAIGCVAYVQVPKQLRWKLQPTSLKTVLVGYGENSRCYRLWDPENKKILESRDVVFNEDINGIDVNDEPEHAPLLDEVETDEEFPIERIIAEDNEGPERRFFVKWKGYPINESTWEPLEHVKDTVALDIWEQEHSSNGNEEDEPAEALTTRQCAPNDTLARPVEALQLTASVDGDQDDPRTLAQALKSPLKNEWIKAMEAEFASLMLNETWDVVPRPIGRPVIGSKWVFKTKKKVDGTIDRYKARFVAKGYSQIHGLDYDETFSPVISFPSLRLILALALKYGLILEHMDVATAYLNGEVDSELYVEQPTGISTEFPPERYVCLLKKGLYGLKQAGRLWNQTLHEFLCQNGFHQMDYEPCVYLWQGEVKPDILCQKRRISRRFIILCIYVDDLVIAARSKEDVAWIKTALSKQFKMSDLGPLHHILGLRVIREERGDALSLDQMTYIEEIIKRFGLQDCNPVSTPLDTSVHFAPARPNELLAENTSYRSAIGSLMYAAIATRPDISTAVGLLARHMERPGTAHWTGMKRVFRYLKGTASFKLVYTRQDDTVEAYSDADWAGDLVDRKSTSGWLIKLCGAAISWKSSKQTSTALSTVEAEYIAASDCAREIIWTRKLLKDLKISDSKIPPFTLKMDNNGAMQLAKNNQIAQRTKHIDIRYHFLRECVKNKEISIERCPSNKMTADALTKAIPTVRFTECRAEMGMKDV